MIVNPDAYIINYICHSSICLADYKYIVVVIYGFYLCTNNRASVFRMVFTCFFGLF